MEYSGSANQEAPSSYRKQRDAPLMPIAEYLTLGGGTSDQWGSSDHSTARQKFKNSMKQSQFNESTILNIGLASDSQRNEQQISLQMGDMFIKENEILPHSIVSSTQNDRLLRKLQLVQGGADTPVPDTETEAEDDEKDEIVMTDDDDEVPQELSQQETQQNGDSSEEFYEAESGIEPHKEVLLDYKNIQFKCSVVEGTGTESPSKSN